jgi:23S rRNA (adenine2503-C2)-methyltransferase
MQIKRSLETLSLDQLKALLAQEGFKPFHAEQIFEWAYAKGAQSFEEMTNLSKELRVFLAQKLRLDLLEEIHIERSSDQETEKFLWKLFDDKLVESVLICSKDRRTVCVSSQVGCPAKCAFCASGKEGFFRNLSKEEITAQVHQIDRYLKKKKERVTHVVFMGMGEPLENLREVLAAIDELKNPLKLHISERRITISTVGLVDEIKQLAEMKRQFHLVLSLHAPNQNTRKKIIPYARKYALEDILSSMLYFAHQTKRDITYEYTLISGINDSLEHALELAKLVKHHPCSVNLIPYNPVEGLKLKRPEKEVIEAFREILGKNKIPVTWRYTKGKDIAAACGQLALKKTEALEKEIKETQRTNPGLALVR